MKKLLAILAMMIAVPAKASTVNIPATCLPLKEVEKVLKEYKEEILFFGLDNIHKIEDLTVNVFLNKNTRTYTIVFIAPSTDLVCVISSGVNGKLVYAQ